jgi:hypothetical protein
MKRAGEVCDAGPAKIRGHGLRSGPLFFVALIFIPMSIERWRTRRFVR